MTVDRKNISFVAILHWLSLFVLATTQVTSNTLSSQHPTTLTWPHPHQCHQHLHRYQRQRGQRSIKTNTVQDQSEAVKVFDLKHVLNPRIDYNNEWRPVGRGDPLKNDPTYDYSPPALERVRYWADSTDKESKEADNVTGSVRNSATESKNEILLLGVSHDRPRIANTLTNSKGELPLLQPKYTSIRRSYFTQQLPTHLMPPPMQTLIVTSFNNNNNNNINNNNNNSIMKSVASAQVTPSGNEFSVRPSIPKNFASSVPNKLTHTKPYYSTTATASWMRTQSHTFPHSPPVPPSSTLQQESEYFLGHTRPNTRHTYSDAHSPNSIRPGESIVKTSHSHRKPWVHELLQKELIKPMRTTAEYKKYLTESVTSMYAGISATSRPINAGVTPITSPTNSTDSDLPAAQHISRISSPTFITAPTFLHNTTGSPTMPSSSPIKSSIFNATRLLIPETNNMVSRPTVAPLELTTDSLFAHYNQLDKPLIGPMYLIIEGHSKVKTYGKDELDPHQPKIVPIIPKREPIVRVANPNEQRGGIETFQVKHLHTKVASPTTTTAKLQTERTTVQSKTKPTAKISPKPTMKTKMPLTNKTTVSSMDSKTIKSMTSNPTTSKPLTTSSSSTTTARSITLDVSSAMRENASHEPPTGMEGLLSLLDASFGNIFQNEPLDDQSTLEGTQQNFAHKSTKRGEDIEVEGESQERSMEAPKLSTTSPSRDVRQVYDYDQLPERRSEQLRGDNEKLRANTQVPFYNDEYNDDDGDESVEYFNEDVNESSKVMEYEENDYVFQEKENQKEKDQTSSKSGKDNTNNISYETKNNGDKEFNKA